MINDPLWYKDAIIYELFVAGFHDSNDDGLGDFRGLMQKLEYLRSLGITAVWLLPFYQSPLRDGGYDIADYRAVNPAYGTLRDVRTFVRAAHEHGIRVITELVVNHTSDQHPWFQRARRAKAGSAARNMYVWSDTPTKYAGTRIIFTDSESSNWAWDPVARAYYWHRFFSHQPDLNYDSPRVRAEVMRMIRFWLDLGVDGLRLDAVPYLVEREGTTSENLPETHLILKEWRRMVETHYPGRMLLAEANQWPADVQAYFGDSDECQMAFHFPLMPRMYMALRQEDRHPITEILAQTPPIPDTCQWGLFLRSHDELTLEMVTDAERDYMYGVYAQDPRMRLNLGIRRRLAPLLENNRRAIELLKSLLFSLPGSPIIYYGDEIGMGDNIYLGDRDGVRTPMQWSGDRNAGFSRADVARLYQPLIVDPLYGFQAINVEAQERSPSSLLNWMRRLIALRRRHKVFGRGRLEFLHPRNRAILAFTREYDGDLILVVANLSRFVQPVELDLAAFAGLTPMEMIGGADFPPVGEEPYFLSLGPHGFYWFSLRRATEPVLIAAGEAAEVGMSTPLVVDGDWDGLFAGRTLQTLEQRIMPGFLATQRWFGGKGRTLARVTLRDRMLFKRGPVPAWFTLWEVVYDDDTRECYSLPLAVTSGRAAERLQSEAPSAVLTAVAGPRGRGVLVEAPAAEAACEALLLNVRDARTIDGAHGTVVATATSAFPELYEALPDHPEIRREKVEQSHTSLHYGRQLVLKLYRRLSEGTHPEIEIGRHLTETVDFPHAPRLAGVLEYRPRRGETVTLGCLHEYVWNQGDGWAYSLREVLHFLEQVATSPDLMGPAQAAGEAQPGGNAVAGGKGAELLGVYAGAAETLGRRVGALHLALAQPSGLSSFDPEPLRREDVRALLTRIVRQVQAVPALLESLGSEIRAADEDLISLVKARGVELVAHLRPLRRQPIDGLKMRVHGDLHLGQVLWVESDFVIIDFEGEVARPLVARRQKLSPLKDVAGILRSFDYVAQVALEEYAGQTADPDATGSRLAPWAAWWQRESGALFWSGYMSVVREAGLLPSNPTTLQLLVKALVLEKALYELEYEVRNRPDWARIPLRGLAGLITEPWGGSARG